MKKTALTLASLAAVTASAELPMMDEIKSESTSPYKTSHQETNECRDFRTQVATYLDNLSTEENGQSDLIKAYTDQVDLDKEVTGKWVRGSVTWPKSL